MAGDETISKINELFGTKIATKNENFIYMDRVIAVLADNNQIDAHKLALK